MITIGKEWDHSLNLTQKKMIARGVFILGLGAWLLFSTPNTISIIVQIFAGVKIFNIPYSGEILAINVGLLFSVGELIFIYLAIWKSKWFWVGVLVCGAIGVGGTLKFDELGFKIQQIKYQEIAHKEKKVAVLMASIRADSTLIVRDNLIVQKYLKAGRRVPQETLTRTENTREKKEMKETKLIREINSLDSLKTATGPLVSLGGNLETGESSIINTIIAVLIEIMVIGCTYINIVMWHSESLEEQIEVERLNNAKRVDARLMEVLGYKKLRGRTHQTPELPPPPYPRNERMKTPKTTFNFTKKVKAFNENESENFQPENENLGEIFIPKVKTFNENESENFHSENENLLNIANQKRLSNSQEIMKFVIKFFTDHPEWSNAKIARNMPPGMKITGQRVGQILKNNGLKRK